MPYFSSPFPFKEVMTPSTKVAKIDLEESIRANIQSLILTRIGEVGYDREMGYDIWDYDKQVFYYDKTPYYNDSKEASERGLLESSTEARNNFTKRLQTLVRENEIRLEEITVSFNFEKTDEDKHLHLYQRKVKIEVNGRIKSTGAILKPSFIMKIDYTPFRFERT